MFSFDRLRQALLGQKPWYDSLRGMRLQTYFVILLRLILALVFVPPIVVVFVLLVAGPQLLYAQYGPAKDASTVSGFYGPGSYLGWQLTATVTGLQYVYGSGEVVGPDLAGFSATAVYTAVATGDAIRRVALGELDAQLDAALMTCRFALLLSGLCVLLTWDGSRWGRLRWWRRLFLLAAAGAAVGDLVGRCLLLEMARFSWMVTIGTCVLVSDPTSIVGCVFMVVCMSLAAARVVVLAPGKFGWPEGVPFDIQLAFPRSEARFGDLDQFSVLVVWGVGSGYVLMPARWRRSFAE